jgi:CheY-like chemotaxis protein
MEEGGYRGRALLVGGDLMARARVDQAAAASGTVVDRTTPGGLTAALAGERYDVVLVDLDEGGAEVLHAIEAARPSGGAPARVVGFFSHVDAELGEAARRAGCEAMPRGRFWRTLPALIGERPAPS